MLHIKHIGLKVHFILFIQHVSSLAFWRKGCFSDWRRKWFVNSTYFFYAKNLISWIIVLCCLFKRNLWGTHARGAKSIAFCRFTFDGSRNGMVGVAIHRNFLSFSSSVSIAFFVILYTMSTHFLIRLEVDCEFKMKKLYRIWKIWHRLTLSFQRFLEHLAQFFSVWYLCTFMSFFMLKSLF